MASVVQDGVVCGEVSLHGLVQDTRNVSAMTGFESREDKKPIGEEILVPDTLGGA